MISKRKLTGNIFLLWAYVECQYPTVKVPLLINHQSNLIRGGGFNNVPDAVISVKTKAAANGPANLATGVTTFTCPLLDLKDFDESGTVTQTSPFFITPFYYTFSASNTVRVNLTALGENFNEFYLQTKDFDDNSVGNWKISDENSKSYQCDNTFRTDQLDTIYWKSSNSGTRELMAEWSMSSDSKTKPKKVVIVGSFKSSSGEYQRSYSQILRQRNDVDLETCCKLEISKDCQRMCSARNLEDALSSALENCKLEMYKLQWCFMTERSSKIDKFTAADEESVMAKNDDARTKCCEKDSVNGECLGLCSGQNVMSWSVLYRGCKGVGRQIYSCWSKTSCVNRCADARRNDFPCQCDVDCSSRGDCCVDKDLTCYIKLPVTLEYWPTTAITCNEMPQFSNYVIPKVTKEISQMKIDAESNPLTGIPVSKFVLRLKTFFNVEAEGAYRFYILLGQSDMGMIKIDNTYMARIHCPDIDSIDTPTTFDALLPMGGHEIVIEYANAGFDNKFRLAYQGPDTKMKPTALTPLDKVDVGEMGYPAELSKSQKALTRPQTSPTPFFKAPTAPPVTTRGSIARMPWARPSPVYRIPPGAAVTPPPTIRSTTKQTTERLILSSAPVTEAIESKSKSFKVIIGTVFGIMAGILAAVIIFKFF